MKIKIISLAILAISCVLFTQCKKDSSKLGYPDLPSTSYTYELPTMPTNVLNNTPKDNPLTSAGATLGRVLFYDTKLSINNKVSCGSCHLQNNAFADVAGNSIGFEGGKTSRNSSTIVNVVNQKSYFWDGRTNGLEAMVSQPIRHQVEMGMEKPDVLPAKLKTVAYYPALFKAAFGSEEVSSEKISQALAQFLRAMTSYDSKADETKLTTPGGWGQIPDPRVTDSERRGAQLFQANNCTSCHGGTNLRGESDENEANIGLELHYVDKGIGELNPAKEGIFKVPSLRNVALTAPYMHDGRFKNLREVINHYNTGIVDHPNLSNFLRNNTWGGGDKSPVKMNLSETDINDLIAFLNTLTDETLIDDVRFSDPFKR